MNVGAAQRPALRGALFEYRNREDAGRLHPLLAGRNMIGRDRDCDVVLEDPEASNRHAILIVRETDASFVDVSRNGSIVQGVIVSSGEQVTLETGARIQIGSLRLVFVMITRADYFKARE
jgi:pSer/pThr/pTyr-binding forkhead associated (FHA) protein